MTGSATVTGVYENHFLGSADSNYDKKRGELILHMNCENSTDSNDVTQRFENEEQPIPVQMSSLQTTDLQTRSVVPDEMNMAKLTFQCDPYTKSLCSSSGDEGSELSGTRLEANIDEVDSMVSHNFHKGHEETEIHFLPGISLCQNFESVPDEGVTQVPVGNGFATASPNVFVTQSCGFGPSQVVYEVQGSSDLEIPSTKCVITQTYDQPPGMDAYHMSIGHASKMEEQEVQLPGYVDSINNVLTLSDILKRTKDVKRKVVEPVYENRRMSAKTAELKLKLMSPFPHPRKHNSPKVSPQSEKVKVEVSQNLKKRLDTNIKKTESTAWSKTVHHGTTKSDKNSGRMDIKPQEDQNHENVTSSNAKKETPKANKLSGISKRLEAAVSTFSTGRFTYLQVAQNYKLDVTALRAHIKGQDSYFNVLANVRGLNPEQQNAMNKDEEVVSGKKKKSSARVTRNASVVTSKPSCKSSSSPKTPGVKSNEIPDSKSMVKYGKGDLVLMDLPGYTEAEFPQLGKVDRIGSLIKIVWYRGSKCSKWKPEKTSRGSFVFVDIQPKYIWYWGFELTPTGKLPARARSAIARHLADKK